MRMIARNGILDPIEFWWVPQMPQMVVPKSSRGQGGPDEAPGGVLKRKVSYLNAKMRKFCENANFVVCVLKVGVTKPIKLQAKLLAEGDDVRADGPRPLYQHRKNPYS